MKIQTSAIFGEQGYTCTSLNHLANIAKEVVIDIENKIKVQLYTKTIAIIGQQDEQVVSKSSTASEIAALPENLEKIARLHGFMAYAREAIKEHERMVNAVGKLPLEWYCTHAGIDIPAMPIKNGAPTVQSLKDEQNIKQIARRLILEAKASVFGKFIHPSGAFSEARKERKEYQAEPIEVNEGGRDTILRKYYFDDISDQTIEEVFFKLQSEHRAIQAQINQSEHDLKEKVSSMDMEAENEYAAAKEEYDNKMSIIKNRWRAWVAVETKRVAALKIVVPNELQPIVNELNDLGK